MMAGRLIEQPPRLDPGPAHSIVQVVLGDAEKKEMCIRD
jgi:hypothetical protein